MESPWVRAAKVCSPQMGHITKTGTMPTYGKNSLINLQNQGPMALGLCMKHRGQSPTMFEKMMTLVDFDPFNGKVKYFYITQLAFFINL